MPALHELQVAFRDTLLSGTVAPGVECIRHDGLDCARRIGIYRNNVFSNLRGALGTLFPVVERLVGEEFFAYAAEEYIRRYPSPAGDLNRFGAQLPEFLAAFEPAAALAYLPDTARLEWLAHGVYHAADHAALDVGRLAAVPPEHYDELCFALHPACALLASPYPVHHIWHTNQPDYNGEACVNLDSGSVCLLVERRAQRVELQVLGAGEWALLQAVAAGQSFGAACDAALAANADFDLERVLARLIGQSTVVDFRLPDAQRTQT